MQRRLFIAVDLAIPVVDQLVTLQREIDAQLPDSVRVRWVAPQNIHLTLRFLGDVDEAMLPRLTAMLEALVEPLFAFQINSRGVGCFPRGEQPRVIWSGFDEEDAQVLSLLRQALERDLELLGFARDPRPFAAHVTLGRVKSRARPDLRDLVAEYQGEPWGKSDVKDFILYESTLTDRGPRYRVLSRFALGG